MKKSDANLKLQLWIVSSLPGRWQHGKRRVGDESRLQLLNHFSVQVYFEVTVEKVGDGGLIGLALQNVESMTKFGADGW